MPHILAINCGSSSIKSKLFLLPSSPSQPLQEVAQASISGIGSKGVKVVFKVEFHGKGVVEEEAGDGGEVDYKDLPGQLLEKITGSAHIDEEDIKYIAHRVVHGGPHKEPIIVTNEHKEGLEEMDKLSAFAPLHNHPSVLSIRSCLTRLPSHTSILCFDTLFHQTLPREVYTYAIPGAEEETAIPLRKYGFHGLSYMSILGSLAKELGKKEKEVSVIVAHLGSGGSVCCIRKGESIDTSMGLTPLEGLVGGTRSGSVDPVVVFHLMKDPGGDAGVEGVEVTKGEVLLNKKSGLQALAGTSNFGLITSRITSPSSCTPTEHTSAKLAYDVYLDRLLHYLTSYLGKLFSSLPRGEVTGLVFSGGIGERSVELRRDVVQRLGWMGFALDGGRNGEVGEGVVERIGGEEGGLGVWVVKTDEEEVCARLGRTAMGI